MSKDESSRYNPIFNISEADQVSVAFSILLFHLLSPALLKTQLSGGGEAFAAVDAF
jgi:hypothetical protein